MMKEESNEGGNECTQLPPCPGVETEKLTMNSQLKDSSGGLILPRHGGFLHFAAAVLTWLSSELTYSNFGVSTFIIIVLRRTNF